VVILDLLREVILQWNPAVHITGITLVKFNHPLLPGQKARVHLEKLSKRIRFQIYRQDRLLAQGEFRCEAG
jgi:3-hydroxymyristoyl/3-hydroxydecanoyl-(acyl carrier protein) dehydratase